MSGPDAGRIVSVPQDASLTIGRSDECAVTIADASLSRQHARLDYVMGEYVLGDLGSSNGTYVNNCPACSPITLKEGDRISLGRMTSMRFALVTQAEADALRAVYDASTRDGLTGLCNRAHLDQRLAADLAFAARHELPLSVVAIDLDYFKRVNDTFGHAAGDAVLRGTAATISSHIRIEDLAARVGGEELLVVLPATPLPGAVSAAERLRIAIEAMVVETGGIVVRVTASFGVASIACAGPDRAALLKIADRRLYEAKRQGRNRVVG